MSAPLLHLEGVARSVRLPDGSWLEILRRIDLTVRAGEHVGIVGRSGTGKSTLLNILGLLDRPTGGHMLWDGTPTARLSQRAASRIRGAQIGFVFQQFNLLPGRTALENVAHPLLYGTAAEVRTRKRRAREVLERLGLGERADQVPTRLSGGEQQRVAIARALVRRPRLLLADEPTGALDVDTGRLVMDLLTEAAQQSTAALITITHDPAIAARADRRFTLDGGVLT
ncbi:MAG TPA: ABC transporter ATP-binding protein [Brevibacterium senegalense]|uniref:ABC transporter ATP-binding protein n=1 Tax=Brevibacterium senegalense TaxID=1033736 RepID=A0A921MDX6_9MICO|nr:ABC transporter ATP-binding protein [Candidatus Brevibacterium intestinigallinarum]HJG80494.1 ABC transporter ATP-binding protein [Brevibacterium senegalense]HLR45090.1 ABC transporter ATP-binding protein [Brevibacterium sp.]